MVQQLSGTTGDTTYETPGIPSWINGLAGGSYTLPVASTTVLGGVKQGSGVTIAGDGTIAASGTAGVGTFNARTGTVVLLTADVTGVLGSGLPVANGGTGATSASAARTALGISTVGNTGAYADLSGRPSLATVATSGAYADITGTPTLQTNRADYVIGGRYGGVPTASDVILGHVLPHAITLPASLTGSLLVSTVAATGTAAFVLSFVRAGSRTTIATFTFSAAGTSAAISGVSIPTLQAGDIIELTAPGTPDATLANLYPSILGQKQ